MQHSFQLDRNSKATGPCFFSIPHRIFRPYASLDDLSVPALCWFEPADKNSKEAAGKEITPPADAQPQSQAPFFVLHKMMLEKSRNFS
ncbi:hypothetical protein F9L69_15600 [Brucella melitensis]|uniref:Uncharacterized protein n=2 Tax=Brucella melitensis TaxID=29459 RepID=C0RMB0_BRUMB|nr:MULTISPECIES: hypothetical protein [Brucella]ACO02743.1 Hypothetical protein, conserved [Brucella melitensis ATCC 23457]EEZ16166.1 predicted protein [Brucella melitensis bv. 2 str. 63/9]AOG54629.1 hypothetical protein BFS11_14665 [Brucella melitensis]ARY01188.1 hypothetical protein BK201_15825 [Brucella melitensis]ARY04380.1 hypothetical protein BK186_15835 [Brucella melitensis]